jgi:uncharacterized RDD family membrane protein YckC
MREQMTERTGIASNAPGDVAGPDPIPNPVAVTALVEDAPPVGAVIRLVAYLLDALVLVIAIYLVALALRAVLGPAIRTVDVGGVSRFLVDRPRSVVDALAATALAGTYFVGSWLRWGATPGQRLIGARVERADGGGRLRPRQAIGRWLLLGTPLGLVSTLLVPAPLVGFVLALVIAAWYAILLFTTIFDRRKRGLHDRLAGSAVRRRPRVPGS